MFFQCERKYEYFIMIFNIFVVVIKKGYGHILPVCNILDLPENHHE